MPRRAINRSSAWMPGHWEPPFRGSELSAGRKERRKHDGATEVHAGTEKNSSPAMTFPTPGTGRVQRHLPGSASLRNCAPDRQFRQPSGGRKTRCGGGRSGRELGGAAASPRIGSAAPRPFSAGCAFPRWGMASRRKVSSPCLREVSSRARWLLKGGRVSRARKTKTAGTSRLLRFSLPLDEYASRPFPGRCENRRPDSSLEALSAWLASGKPPSQSSCSISLF
ncbi:uncharacterized protein LOC128341083 [Hemicordylus capensis]|uniref:uncharacterized protein LOC128341083 n=1 Tax=Hemicordylus capensis TaxID=884348 RepID=UPI002302C81F|nr:uncharacterized protein LOC128341083 [Hemicordylus capensis]